MQKFSFREIISGFDEDKTQVVDFLTFGGQEDENNDKIKLEDTFFGKMNTFFETTIDGKLIPLESIDKRKKLFVKANWIHDKKYFSLSFNNNLELYVLRKPLGANFSLNQYKENWSTVILLVYRNVYRHFHLFWNHDNKEHFLKSNCNYLESKHSKSE